MQKTVTFVKHRLTIDPITGNLIGWFEFSVIDSSLIGTPRERGKDLLRTFLNGRSGDSLYTFEEIRAGAGVIDAFVISPGGKRVVVELKMCGRGYSQPWAQHGMEQLIHYMENKNTLIDYLIVLDSRTRDFSQGFQLMETINRMSIATLCADLRPYVKRGNVPSDFKFK